MTASPLPADLLTALEVLAKRSQLLLAVDFDGVLAEIVEQPADARPVSGAVEVLHALAERDGVHVAVVSGRTLADLRALAKPPGSAVLIGCHGAEVHDPAHGQHHLAGAEDAGFALTDPRQADLRQRVIQALADISAAHPGTHVELKPSGAVLHTRQAERGVAERASLEALDGPAGWAGVHTTEGKEVVELSVVDVTKGLALQQLRERIGLPAGGGGLLYTGDDVTDERAFAVLDDEAGDVTVKVGPGQTLARHRLPDPSAVVAMLQHLLALRPVDPSAPS